MKNTLHSIMGVFAVLAVCGVAKAAIQESVETFDTAGNLDGWMSDNTRVVASNPGGWLEIKFKEQYGPSVPEQCKVYAGSNTLGGTFIGNYVAGRISELRFDFMAVDARPSVMWVSIVCGSGREWYRVIACPAVGTWGTYTIPVAFGAGWLYSPLQTEQMFWDDMRDVRTVGVFVLRSATGLAERYRLDNIALYNGRGLDSDGDGVNDLIETAAGTDPYSTSSTFRIVAASVGEDYVLVRWASVAGRSYSLLSCTNLLGEFLPLASGIPATPPENEYKDTTATGKGPYFYKVGVEP